MKNGKLNETIEVSALWSINYIIVIAIVDICFFNFNNPDTFIAVEVDSIKYRKGTCFFGCFFNVVCAHLHACDCVCDCGCV